MLSNFTAKYRKIPSGYMGQIMEWPEVISEGKTLEECREMLEDALKEVILAYAQLDKAIPQGRFIFESMTIDVPVLQTVHL